MKRKLIGTVLAASLALGLTACANKPEVKPEPTPPPKTEEPAPEENTNEEVGATLSPDMKAIFNKLVESKVLKVEPIDSTPAKDFYVFEPVKDKIEDGFASKALINVKLQDVFVIKTKNPKDVESTLKDYLGSQEMKSFGDGYGGEENIEAVRNAKIGTVNDYVYFIAAPNTSEVEAKLTELLK